jgi:hypothetical protein
LLANIINQKLKVKGIACWRLDSKLLTEGLHVLFLPRKNIIRSAILPIQSTSSKHHLNDGEVLEIGETETIPSYFVRSSLPERRKSSPASADETENWNRYMPLGRALPDRSLPSHTTE